MTRIPTIAFRILVLSLGLACGPTDTMERSARPTARADSPTDPHSYSRPDSARVYHVALDLTPDFEARRIRGRATLQIQRIPGADSVILDTRDLRIRGIRTQRGNLLGWSLSRAEEHLGSRLAVELPPSGPGSIGRYRTEIVIDYETSPDAAAVQWLTPEQTAGGRLPFLFTQGQAILTRTWIPTQDSPGVRQSYEAVVRVPAGMRAVMSAERYGAEGERDTLGLSVYRYRMRHPIPSYLIALAVGELEFRELGRNAGVYAEPNVIDRAAHEFAEVNEMMAAAERLYGPYRWGRYDVLVLPPSFPFGGMENPTLTFATPTIIAGDRSLVSLVAHELAHSWSGNLVTNATWDHFWLNEGFTTYIENRLMEELRGRDYADMLRQLGRQDLERSVADLEPSDTRLHLDLVGRDPDDGLTSVAYEKGAAFLETVESVVGRRRFDAWLRGYFDRHAFQPMISQWLIEDMREHLLRDGEEQRIGVEEWIRGTGVPANVPPVQSRLLATVDTHVVRWNAGARAADIPARQWSTHEWLHFLRALPQTMPRQRLAELDDEFALTRSGNAEILQHWLVIAIRNRYEPAFPALDRFLTSQGRRKFLTPLYTELMRTDWGRAMARDIYSRARPTYHAISTGTLDRVLNWQGGS